MRKIKRIRKVAASIVLMGALVIPIHAPIASMVPGTPVITMQTKAEAKAVLSKKQAKKKLIKWLKRRNLLEDKLIIAYDHKKGGDYFFHAYFDEGDHTSTQNWYYVNSKTGVVRAEF